MEAEPTAVDIFAELRRDAGPKFGVALDRIKAACDNIQAANGAMTYSQIGKVAEHLYGGPKTQSILNNAKHKSYIDARRRENLQAKPRKSGSKQPLSESAVYPSDGLDFKTRRYIDDLRQRNLMLESAMRELKEQVLATTESRPLDLSKMLGNGPDADSSMTVTPSQPCISPEAIEAIKILTIELPLKVPSVELFQGKALRLRTGEWLVTPIQYAALKSLFSEGVEKQD